jgi:undecaprenyl pyrophosphate synthase
MYNLYVALSYGGRAEILSAVKQAVAEKGLEGVENMSEDDFGKYLWTGGMPTHRSECYVCGRKRGELQKEACGRCVSMPDPDIIIRTSGEQRLSGFLPWQGVYSELFFTDTYWPAFTETEFKAIINEYTERERRRGK